jgi:hypothetical protein
MSKKRAIFIVKYEICSCDSGKIHEPGTPPNLELILSLSDISQQLVVMLFQQSFLLPRIPTHSSIQYWIADKIRDCMIAFSLSDQ